MYTSGPVIVMQLPEQLSNGHVKTFLEELEPLLDTDRPRIVLDCSQIRQIDSAGVEMLLHCMEAAMKRDGDVKLAALSRESEVILELMRVGRLFETFENTSEAVQSFQGVPSLATPQSESWPSAALGWLGDLKAAS